MEQIRLPEIPIITQVGDSTYKLEMGPLYPGYGVTLGNSLRRSLLSSLPGAAVTAVKIKFADHEFSTIPHVKEDVVQLILNIKKLAVRSFSLLPTKIRLHVQREGVVTAGDIQETDQVNIINKDLYLATIDSPKGELDIEFTIEQGRGYVPVESREHEKHELGVIAVDAIYTPVKAVYFDVSNVRVGQKTDFDQLVMTVETNGTLDGKTAFDIAASILIDHFNLLLAKPMTPASDDLQDESPSEDEESGDVVVGFVDTDSVAKNENSQSIEASTLSTRAKNVVTANGINTAEELMTKTNEEIAQFKGLGKKTQTEILMFLGRE